MMRKIVRRKAARGQTHFPKKVNGHDYKPIEYACSHCFPAYGSFKYSGSWYPRARMKNNHKTLKYFGYDNQFNIVGEEE